MYHSHGVYISHERGGYRVGVGTGCFSPTKPSQQPSMSAPLEGVADHSQWLDRIQQGAVREYRPVLPGSVCRYVPPPVPVARVVPTCVVGEPEDWEREYADTQVSTVASQVDPRPFRLRDYRTGGGSESWLVPSGVCIPFPCSILLLGTLCSPRMTPPGSVPMDI